MFDYQGAIKAGAKEEDILKFLSDKHGFDYQGAINSGAKEEDILKFLSERQTQPTPITKQQPGFFKSLITDPIKTLLVKPADRFAEMVGRSGLIPGRLGRDIKTGYEQMADNGESRTFGGINVEAQKSLGSGGGRQIIGDIAKTGSYLYTGGAGANAVSKGLAGKVISGSLQGAKAGVVGGGLYSFGDAVQEAENQPMDVAIKTLFGATVGGATGGILGAATPLVVKATNAIKPLTTETGALNSLSEKYGNFLGMTGKQTRLEEKFGKDTPKFLANEFRGELPLGVSGGNRDLGEAIGTVKTKYDAEAQAFNTVLRESGEYGSIDNAVQKAKNLAREQFSGTDLQKALDRIDNEATAFKQQYKDSAVLDYQGNERYPIADIDEIKKYQWSRERSAFGSPDANLNNDTNFLLGKGFQEEIQNVVKDAPVQKWNKRLGDFASSIRILENRNGLKTTNSYLNRLTGRIIGGVTGGAISGPLGTIPATITGDWVAQQLSNPDVNGYFIKQVLKKLPTAERSTIVAEAEQILNQIQSRRASQLKLPSPSFIPVGPKTDTSGLIKPKGPGSLFKYLENLKSSQKAALGNQRNLSAKIPPTTKPTTIQKSNNIKNSIPNKRK